MCLAVPVQIITINGNEAEVDIGGVRRKVSIMLTPEVKIGEYVLLHAGYAINILNEAEAKETLQLFQQIADINEIP
jgi:hydrogenase expression/formation protein HypC